MTRPLRIGYFAPRFPGLGQFRFRCEISALEAEGHCLRPITDRPPPSGLAARDGGADLARRTRALDRLDPTAALRAAVELAPRGLYLSMLAGGPRFAAEVTLALSAAGQLSRFAREERLDHIHVPAQGRPALVAALARRMGGPPLSLALDAPLPGAGAAQRFVWREAAFAFAATEALRSETAARLGTALPGRFEVRPPGIEVEAFARDAPYAPVRHGRPMQLFSHARLAPEKGQLDLLSAMRQLLDLGVDVRLELAGEDAAGGTGFRKTLEAHLKQLHLRDHVRMPGALPVAGLRARLHAADAFVHPGRDSALGFGCLAAMAAGVPVIAADSPGTPEIVRDGRTGILVPSRNPGALARALRDFAGNPDYALQLSIAARQEVEARFLARPAARLLAERIAASA